MTSLLKPAEVHSYEVYQTFLVAGHFFIPLFHFALHTRFHWLLSRSDIAYQIKHNQQFLSSGTLTLSNPYYFIYDQHPHLFPVCLLSYSHSLLHTPSPLRGCILLKYEPYQNPLLSTLDMLNAVLKVRLWWCQTLRNPFLQLLSHYTNHSDLFQTLTPPSALWHYQWYLPWPNSLIPFSPSVTFSSPYFSFVLQIGHSVLEM